jgi:hypothetical protein
VKPIADSSYYRDRAEQVLRLARDNTDPLLVKALKAFAAECSAKADALDGVALGQDPDDE